MNFKTNVINVPIDINGTCLQGVIKCGYKRIRKIFGEHGCGDGWRVNAEWIIKFEDGTVATIYNWENGSNWFGGKAIEKIRTWHIGGFNEDAAKRVVEILI